MSAENNERPSAEPTAPRNVVQEETLTDVIDQWSRRAFQRALDRRHA
jgi:hypothetical protein